MTVTKAPVIGITADTNMGRESELIDYKGETVFWLKDSYTNAIEKSGGIPLILPVTSKPKLIGRFLEIIDGLLLSGGYFDVDPAVYGEKPAPQTGPLKPDRTMMEIKLFKKADKLGMPILGICGGMQAINVGLGGSLYQHIPDDLPGALDHKQKPIPVTKPSHSVVFVKGSMLRKLTGSASADVNSTHHQGVKKVGRGLAPCAIAPDGIVEAFERTDQTRSFLLGVQWHPEQLFDHGGLSRKLIRRFVAECRKYRKR